MDPAGSDDLSDDANQPLKQYPSATHPWGDSTHSQHTPQVTLQEPIYPPITQQTISGGHGYIGQTAVGHGLMHDTASITHEPTRSMSPNLSNHRRNISNMSVNNINSLNNMHNDKIRQNSQSSLGDRRKSVLGMSLEEIDKRKQRENNKNDEGMLLF